MPQGYIDVPMTPKQRQRVSPPPDARAESVRRALDVSQGTNTRDAIAGVRSAHATTAYHGADLVRRGWNALVPERFEAARVINTPQAQAAMTAPDSPAGRAGRMVGQAAEFAVPLTRVAKVMRSAPLVQRAGMDALASGSVAAVQSGGDFKDVALATVGGAVLPFAGAAARATGRAAQRAAAGAKEGGVGGAVASAIRNVAPGEPRTLLIQALKPRSVKVNFPSSLDRALPELKAAEQAIGKPIASVDTLLDATKLAKQNLQRQLNIVRGTAQGLEIDGSSVADAMQRSIPRKLALERPDAAKQLLESANVYRRGFKLDEMETLLRETNAELEGLYLKYPGAQRKALTADPEWARLDAQGKAIRSAIDAGLDRIAGGGTAAKELRRRYGALLDVEGEAHRRAMVAARQQPESLSEQIGAVRAAADVARGAWRLAHFDAAGAADIAAGYAGRSTAKHLKEQQTTDALIRRAFEGYRGSPSPVPMPTRRPVRGLLPAGARPMHGVPDASGGRGVSAWENVQYSGTPRQLPPGRTARPMPGDVAPAPPDPSGGRTIPAAPIDYAVDPTVTVKAGGFRVAQFSSDPDAVKAAVATPDVRDMLERMADDLREFAPKRGRLVKNEALTEDYYVHGAPGSPVGDDIRTISEEHVGNNKIAKAIRDLLEGKTPTNRLHTAALDAAMGYLEKRPSYRGPTIPAGWKDADPEFEAFSRAVDDLAE